MYTHKNIQLARKTQIRYRSTTHKPNMGSYRPRAFDAVEMSKFVGDGIGAFTLFYCTLNYIMYKRIVDESTENKNNNKK